MKFYPALLRTAFSKPSLAAEALYWHVTGKKKRARNRLRAHAEQSPGAYRLWIKHKKACAKRWSRPCDIAAWPHRPRISVLLYHAPGESEAQYERRLAALEAQVYQDWELVVAQSREALMGRNPAVPRLSIVPGRTDNPAKALGLGLATASCDYVLPLPRDALLAPDALYRLAKALVENPGARVVYGDEDRSRLGGAAASHGSSRAGTPICFWRRIIFGRLPDSARGSLAVPASPALAEAGLAACCWPSRAILMLRWCMCRMCCATTPRPPGKPPPMRWRKRRAWPPWRGCWPTKARRRRPAPSICGGGMAPARRSAAGFHHHPHARPGGAGAPPFRAC
jgi:hypothetical protein